MKKLYLFTNHFPFGKGEEFIETEILYLSKAFDRIHIIPLARSTHSGVRPVPANADYSQPLISSTLKNKTRLVLLAATGRVPLRYVLREFFNRRVYRQVRWVRNWLSYSAILAAALGSSRLRPVLKSLSSDSLAYFYWGDNAANLAPFIRRRFQGAMVVRLHGGDLYEERKGNYLPYRQQLYEAVDLAVFISQHGQAYFKRRYPNISVPSLVSRLGVADSGIAIAGNDNTLHLVSCSGINEVKRVHLIAQALKQVDFKVNWVHFGWGDRGASVAALLKELPDNVNTSLKGAVSNSEVIEYYKTHPVDLFINVSAYEGIPVAVMEAISFGIPVMATCVGGLPEIVNEQNGVLVCADISPAALADELKKYKEIPHISHLRLGARKTWKLGFDAAKNYSDFSTTLSSLLDHLLNRNVSE